MPKLLRAATPIQTLVTGFALIVLVDPVEIAVSLAVLAVGVLVYAYFSPKRELAEAKASFLSEEEILRRAARQRTTFLAHPIFHLKLMIYRRRKIKPAIFVTPEDDPTKEQME